MAVPDYGSLMLPVLRVVAGAPEMKSVDIKRATTSALRASEEDLQETTATGLPLFNHRIEWAIHYLFKARLIERVARGTYKLSQRGRDLLASGVERIDWKYLQKYPEFQQWLLGGRESAAEPATMEAMAVAAGAVEIQGQEQTPLDLMQKAYLADRERVIDEVLDALRALEPAQFERLIVKVMESLGYTGPYGAGIRTQQSSDGGIDGVITQDRLGLDRILLQAKKWTNKVDQPEVQKFLGALQTQGATKGVFITTSEFTRGAQTAVEKLATRVVLIGGIELAALMFDHGVGVDTEATYALKRLDQDFFDEV